MRLNPAYLQPASIDCARPMDPGRDIPSAMEGLEKSVLSLRENVAILLSRLDVVSSAGALKDSAGGAVPECCPLGSQIRTFSGTIQDITASVVDALQRLQLP